MKTLRCLIALSFCLGLTCVSRADSLDFKMDVLDPLSGGIAEHSNTFSVSFTSCASFSNAPAGLTAADGCFEGMNAVGGDGDSDDFTGTDTSDDSPGQTWTSLNLTFLNNSFLAGITPTCDTLGLGFDIYGTTSCSLVGGNYLLNFSGGSIAPGESFFIAERSPITPAEFGTGQAVAGTAPEPNSIVLLSSGVMMVGMLLYAERRRMLRSPVRS